MARLGRTFPAKAIVRRALPTTLTIDVNGNGIASGEAIGSHTVSPGPVSITPTGIASAEAFGTAQLNLNITCTGIASAEAFGTPTVAGNSISPTGIASAEAFGSATITTGPVSITATGIASGEALGTPSVAYVVGPTGIGTAEAFGTPEVALRKYRFRPPIVIEAPLADNVLMYRYKLAHGVTVLKNGSVYSEKRYPSDDDLKAATKFYLGGHEAIMDYPEALDLINAGYGAYVEGV